MVSNKGITCLSPTQYKTCKHLHCIMTIITSLHLDDSNFKDWCYRATARIKTTSVAQPPGFCKAWGI